MMWHSRRAGEGLAWCRLLHTRSCISVDAVRGARGLEFVVRLPGAQIAVRSPMSSPAYIVIAALLPSHGITSGKVRLPAGEQLMYGMY
jgi:hypothetical protein